MPSEAPQPVPPIQAVKSLPLYRVVQSELREAIDRGQYAPGQQLPSTKALAERMSVSLVTVHRALQELVSAGVLRRGQGRGTFVHEEHHGRSSGLAGTRFGLVFQAECSLADHYHSHILEGVRQRAIAHGVDLVLLRYGEDWRNECAGYLYVNPLRSQLDRSPRFSGADASERQSMPRMVLGADLDIPGVSCVDTDNRRLARQAVEFLVRLGHRRIGLIGSREAQVTNNLHRREGFEQGCVAAGLPIRADWIIDAPGWRLDDDARSRLVALLSTADRPTALFCAGYYFALDAYRAAALAGVNVPRDLSIVGVDDPPSAEHLSPSLATMRQPLLEIGRRGFDALVSMIQRHQPAQRLVLRPALIERASVAAPAPGVPG